MFVIKPLTPDHARTIEKFMSDDLLGITSLPRNRHFLHQKLNTSLSSFAKKVTQPQNEHYFFVLEDIQTGEIGGICGIEAKAGIDNPVYSYYVEMAPSPDTDLPVPRKQIILHLHIQNDGPTEIGSLYILPAFRKEGLGRLLSLSRFLFIAAFPERFEEKIVAEMRGYIDEKGQCPFWNGVGKHFLNIEFDELMNLLDEIKDSIPLFAPQHPIYASLLNEEVQEAIGTVHLNSQPALNLLMQEGFSLTDEVDIFDAGPKIEALTHEIRSVKSSRLAKIKLLSHQPIDSERYIVSNNKINFHACYSCLELIENEVILPAETAHALGVSEGDQIRYVASSTKAGHP
jgi:arginine N-succinyltransferase